MKRSMLRLPFILLCSIILFARLAGAAEFNVSTLVNKETMKPKGQWTEATVPDTLDLAARAAMAINNLTQAPWDCVLTSENLRTKVGGADKAPPFVNMKQLRTLPLLRAMCGSEQNLDVEAKAMQGVMDGIANAAARGDMAAIASSRSFAVALMNWYYRDGNPEWLKVLAMIDKGVKKSIIHKEDRAYFPTSAEPPEQQFVPYTPPDEPPIDQIGREGTVRWDNSWGLRALVLNYRFNHDKSSLELARKIQRFLFKPKMWEDTGALNAPGWQHGLFAGHFHGGLTGLHALYDLAVAENDGWLKQVVWEAYNHARSQGIMRLGWFPTWFPATSYKRPKEQSSYCESCGIADLAVLAVKLSAAGLGDYWDDVDSIVRNQLAEQQFTDLDAMRKVSGNDPAFDPLLKRMLGGWGLAEPSVNGYCYMNWYPQVIAGCCSPNAAYALFYIWNGMVHFQNDTATVELLLNRASPWLDVDSYLPYEGKVVLHNKQARTALVRMPHWVDAAAVRCTVNDTPASPAWSGRRLVLTELKPGDKITITFPVPEFKDQQYDFFGKTYSLDLRGSTVVALRPACALPGRMPLYQRESMKAAKAPMHTVKRFVAQKQMPLP